MTFTDKNKTIRITSLASGGLLQEYFTLSTLIRHGYNDIFFTIIDTVYPDIEHKVPKITKGERKKFEEHGEPKDKEGKKRFFTEQINRLNELIAEEISKYPDRKISFGISIQSDAYKYIETIENLKKDNPVVLTDVLSLVDPSSDFPPQTDTTSYYKNFADRKPPATKDLIWPAFFFFPYSNTTVYGIFNTGVTVIERHHLASPTPKQDPTFMQTQTENNRPGSCIWITFYDLIKTTLSESAIVYTLYDKGSRVL